MGKLNCRANLLSRSNKLATATSCVGGSSDPRLKQLPCVTKQTN